MRRAFSFTAIAVAPVVVSLLIPVPLLAAGAAVGEEAPPIIASSWVQGTPIESYESGRVYVVDLWSTWCKPCIKAMPRLKELEGKYAENATFVEMNVWELDPRRIPGFMESHGANMPAIVALDSIPDGREVNEGFTASGFLGLSEEIMIPKSFIVDQKGLIAWVGHPDFLEGPLAAVIEGSWDAEAFAKELGSETANKAVSSGADSRFAPTTLR